MGGLTGNVDALARAKILSGNIRQVVYPAAAARVAIVSDGAAAAWAFPAAAAAIQIVAGAVVTDPTWLAALFISAPVVEAHYGQIQIGIGAAGPVMNTALADFPYDEQLFAVVEGKSLTVPCFYPIRIAGTPMLVGRVRKSSAASAAGASVKLIHIEAVGT